MKFTAPIALALGVLFGSAAQAQAQTHTDHAPTTTKSLAPTPASTDMAEGEIRRIDKDNRTLTIRHGEIKNIDMPGMTMVFQVKSPDMLESVQVGDKIRFAVEKSGSALIVTDLQAVKK